MAAVSGASRFKKFALFCLLYNLWVSLWGAYVRATGSGAGCGSHWPLCNGEIIPRPERIQTWIELTHRVSSGLCLVFTLALMLWAWKVFSKTHLARKASNWAFIFTISEALIGAGLVLLSLVEHDQSVNRAISISLHLVNTLVLLLCLTLAVKASWNESVPSPEPQNPKVRTGILGMLAAMLALGITGALTALGDTLFRSPSFSSGWAQDFAQGSHFLIKLRILHPIFAVIVAVLLFVFSEFCTRHLDSQKVRFWSTALRATVLFQLALGGINLILLAPIPLQLLHLFVADLIWISLVMLASESLSARTFPARTPVAP